MKKYLLLAAIAATAFTACTSDEAVELNPGEAINFRTAVGASTRSVTDVTGGESGTIANIYVYATHEVESVTKPYFNPNYLEINTKGEYVTENTKAYWPTDGTSLKFYAMNAKNGETTTDIGTDNIINRTSENEATVTVATPTEMYDFCYAYNEGTKLTMGASGVPLNFKHALSKITVKALNNNSTIDIKVVGYKIFNLKSKGMFAGLASADAVKTTDATNWTTSFADVAKYRIATPSFLGDGDVLTTSATQIGEDIYVIPQKVGTLDTATPEGVNYKTDETNVFIGVLCKIVNKADGSTLFPVAATGLDLYKANGTSGSEYGYACTILKDDVIFKPNTHTTITLNMTNGGYYDDKANHPVFDENSEITYKVTVATWETESKDVTL